MPESIPSKHPSRPGRTVCTTLLVGCLALPVLLALPACGGDPDSSKVNGAGAGTSTGTGGGSIFDPVGNGGASNGAAGNGSGLGPAVGGSGPYMLPADYTKADLGGYKLGGPVDVGAGGASGTAGAGGSATSGCGTAILGVVRDFKGINEPGGHPDFEAYSGVSASLGIVKDTLGDDQKPVYNSTTGIVDPNNGKQTTGKAEFDQWYRATPDVNKPYLVYLYFEPKDGVLTFSSSSFFPLDGQGWGNTCTEDGATCKKWSHNFGFTTEVHTQFSYMGGETFKFTGDDDLWVFINHKLAIDLGGLHRQLSKLIALDDVAAKLGIKIGQTYDLDLFHAERHTQDSNFRVDTTLAFTNCGTVIEEPPVK